MAECEGYSWVEVGIYCSYRVIICDSFKIKQEDVLPDGDVGSAAFRGLPKWASWEFEERLLINEEAKTSLFELPHADEHGVGQVRDK